MAPSYPSFSLQAVSQYCEALKIGGTPTSGLTPIKPALALLMANLARVQGPAPSRGQGGTVVLDPYCGTGSLLAGAAGHICAPCLVGCDVDLRTPHRGMPGRGTGPGLGDTPCTCGDARHPTAAWSKPEADPHSNPNPNLN